MKIFFLKHMLNYPYRYLNKTESIQKRALRFLLDDDESSYKILLSKSRKNSMYINRLKILCTEIFKTINDLNPSYLKTIFNKSPHDRPVRIHNKNNLVKMRVNTVKYGEKSLSNLGPVIWNKLPGHIKTSDTLVSFKQTLKFWDGEKCLCTKAHFS